MISPFRTYLVITTTMKLLDLLLTLTLSLTYLFLFEDSASLCMYIECVMYVCVYVTVCMYVTVCVSCCQLSTRYMSLSRPLSFVLADRPPHFYTLKYYILISIGAVIIVMEITHIT